MVDYRTSYRKTLRVATGVALTGGMLLVAGVVLAWTNREEPLLVVGLGLGLPLVAIVSAWLAAVALGAWIALRREALERRGLPYAATSRREAVPSPLFAVIWSALARWRDARTLGLRPGEWVEIRTLAEIRATVDENGALDGLPFMAEMARHCGRRARVFRRVDKLHDWVHGTGLRRMRDLVLLEGLRCDGLAHGGCQARCHLRWHEAWLRRAGGASEGQSNSARRGPEIDLERLAVRREGSADTVRYVCQATELTAGGTPLSWPNPSHWMRDLLTGNVRSSAFVAGVALACFNRFQDLRGGAAFPTYAVGASSASPHEAIGLTAGEIVTVKPKHRIEETLNNRSRNRGLWFDREMLRHCGGEYRVARRVERVIVEKTGELRDLTNPCIVLEGVMATGEYLGFNPENEDIFWREIWLERVARPVGAERVASAEPVPRP